jgi:hypothetical protein
MLFVLIRAYEKKKLPFNGTILELRLSYKLYRPTAVRQAYEGPNVGRAQRFNNLFEEKIELVVLTTGRLLSLFPCS